MTNLLALFATSSTPTTVAKSTTGSSSYTLVIFAVLFGVVYLAFIRPRSRRQRQARTESKTLNVGDRVMSVGGIFGTVVAIDDVGGPDNSTVEVEVSPEIVLTFLRRAVNARPLPDTAAESDEADNDEADGDESAPEDSEMTAEPFGDFDAQGGFHEHGQTPSQPDEPVASNDEVADLRGQPAPGTPRSTGGTGSEAG